MQTTETIDLFDHPELIPENVRLLLNKIDWDETYLNCEELRQHLHHLGFTFDYGLDAIPYNLRKAFVVNLNDVINLRGSREQAFKFGCSRKHGGMKQCYTRGCEIFNPLQYALHDTDISKALQYMRAIEENLTINAEIIYTF